MSLLTWTRAAMEKRWTNRDHDDGPIVKSLAALRSEENICRRCPLYKNATQAVAGEGPKSASMMLVGEQPGDQEDRAGHPFVGPAGRLLDKALADAGIARKEVFVTNAVKHFKHEMRGKRRLHKRPNACLRVSCIRSSSGNFLVDDSQAAGRPLAFQPCRRLVIR